MSTAIFEAKASGMATKNDALRDAFAVDDTVCHLMKRDQHTSALTVVKTLTSGYRIKFDDNRAESGLFRYASTELGFRDDWAEATHIGYGAESSLAVFAFIEGEKDTIDPDASSVYWSARIEKVANELT
jgi:hypothetical protein